MRLRKKPWIYDEIMQYTSYMVNNPEECKGRWKEAFGNQSPIYAEFGTGRGNFITTLANQNPNINYIALEQKQEVLVKAVRRANELKLSNIKFILNNAEKLTDFFDERELTRIYLNFVDPWPKKRHAKRRLTHKMFLEIYRNILTKDGEIHIKTDNDLLFEFTLNESLQNRFFPKNISLNLYRKKEMIDMHVQTEYEKMFIEQGKPIFRAELIPKRRKS